MRERELRGVELALQLANAALALIAVVIAEGEIGALPRRREPRGLLPALLSAKGAAVPLGGLGRGGVLVEFESKRGDENSKGVWISRALMAVFVCARLDG